MLTRWCRGQNVGNCWAGGGKRWTLRTKLPIGTFDSTEEKFDLKTAADDTAFDLRINTDSTTDALWIDDITMTDAATPTGPTAGASSSVGLSMTARLNPVTNAALGPVLKLRSTDDGKLGGEGMWALDCIQIGIDADPALPKSGTTNSCFELGFWLPPDGPIACYAWHNGAAPFGFGNVVTERLREPDG